MDKEWRAPKRSLDEGEEESFSHRRIACKSNSALPTRTGTRVGTYGNRHTYLDPPPPQSPPRPRRSRAPLARGRRGHPRTGS